MQFTWDELIGRARVYVDDDHADTEGYIAPGVWLTFGNVELANLRKKWIRSGLVTPAVIDYQFTGGIAQINGVLATVGVAEDRQPGAVGGVMKASVALGTPSNGNLIQSVYEAKLPGTLGNSYTFAIAADLSSGQSLVENQYSTVYHYAPAPPSSIRVGDMEAYVVANSTLLNLRQSGNVNDTIPGDAPFGTVFLTGGTDGKPVLTQPRVLSPAQSVLGRAPYWDLTSSGKSAYWDARGDADTLTYTLHPVDPSGVYFIRYIPTLAYAKDSSLTIDLPYGGDERLVIGMARRSMVKESATSRLLDGLMMEADAEAAFTAAARSGEAPRVRRVARNPLGARGQQAYGFPANPALWRF